MTKRPHSLLNMTSHHSSYNPQQQDNTPAASSKQLPALVPLPVFRFSSVDRSSESEPNSLTRQPLDSTRRRHTFATLFQMKKNQRSHSFDSEETENEGNGSSRNEAIEDRDSESPKRSNAYVFSPSSSIRGKWKNVVQKKTSIPMVVATRKSSSSSLQSNTRNPYGFVRSNPIEENGNYSPTKSRLGSTGTNGYYSVGPSIMHNDGELNEYEEKLLQFAAEGNLEGVKELFTQQSYYVFTLDVNCVDSLDRTPLSIATLNGRIEIVKFLLSDEVVNLKLGDALFFAIQCEFYEAIELLLEKDPQTALQILPGTTSPFEPGLTPFMLAAHKNNFKILSLLYKYSHRLTFSKNELLLDEGFDPYSWDAVMERLLHYRAKASPSFMLLMYSEKGMSWDPLNTAMDLFGELHELAKREREVDESYLAMAEGCESFALELLQEVRSASELADFMRYDLEEDDSSFAPVDGETGNDTSKKTLESKQKLRNYLKPIEKAVKYEMKDFVTSDNSQLALIYIQKGKLFRRLKGAKAAAVQIFLGMLFPVLSIAFLFWPKSYLGQLMANPTVKFWCWLASEVVFVAILLTNTILMQYNGSDGLNSIPPLLGIAFFWILGKFIQELREILHQGLREYLSDIWNWNDICTIFFYTAFMLLRFIHIVSDNTVIRGNQFWHEQFYDPLLLSDICIAISYILIHMRIMELLRAERTFGPLQVSLDLMLHDTFRFLVIFSIVFLAFGSGITELYTPYAIDKMCTCNDTTQCNTSLPMIYEWKPDLLNETNNGSLPPCLSCKKSSENAQQMSNFVDACSGLFWTMFGYGLPSAWYPISNCPEDFQLQELAGAFIIGIYHIAAIIVLVNMLIAMMSNSFQKTHDDSEREWKFHRTELWLKFIRDEINRPPPMNLIPRLKVIKLAWRKTSSFFSSLCSRNSSFQSESGSGNNKVELRFPLQQRAAPGPDSRFCVLEGEGRYCKVIRLVVLRYMKQKVLNGEMIVS